MAAPFAAPGPFDTDHDATPTVGPPMTPKAAAAVLVDLGHPDTTNRPALARRALADRDVRDLLWRRILTRHHPSVGGSSQTMDLAAEARAVLDGSWG